MTDVLNFIQRTTDGFHRRTRNFRIERELERAGLSQALKIPTFTVPEELEMLYGLAKECAPDSRVLEIGSYLGASTCYLAAGLRGPKASIVCVDTWQNQTMPDGIKDTFAEFENNLKSVKQRLTLVRKTTAEVLPAELGAKFDLIFLDGDHSYDQTKADFSKFSGLLAEHGTLAFHDSLYFEGVSRIIGEALASAQWQIGGAIRNLFWIKRAQFLHKS